jgi:hypothetical protein
MIWCADHEYQNLTASAGLFPPSITNDPWVLYHATSSLVEGEVEAFGLVGKPSVVSGEHVLQLVTLYRRINWAGIHSDGYAALASFALGRNRYPWPHTWFRETSMHSLVYAQRSWAGGEWVMSFRQAFEDIQQFVLSEKIRATHLKQQIQTCKDLVARDGAPSRVIEVNIEAVAAALELLRPAFRACFQCVSEYKYGVVYAVRFSEEDVANLSDEGGAGILYLGAVPPDRLLAKARLHLGEQPAPWNNNSSEESLSWSNSDLARKIRTNGHRQIPPDKKLLANYAPRDWLGQDISLQIAREYGSAAVQDMLASGKIYYNDF